VSTVCIKFTFNKSYITKMNPDPEIFKIRTSKPRHHDAIVDRYQASYKEGYNSN